MTRLVIHPGFHKTGTTALQQAMFKARSILKEQGVLYPDTGGEAQHRLAFAINGRSWGWEDKGGKRIDFSEWTSFVREASRFEGTVIISSESLIELTPEQIKRVQTDVAHLDTEIIFTFRPLPNSLVSIYQQYVKAGLHLDFSTWLEAELHSHIKERKSRLWRRHSHDILIQRWLDLFPKVTLIAVDPQFPDFLFRKFEEKIGLQPNTLRFEDVSNVNRSLSLEELNVLRSINSAVRDQFTWDEYLYFVRGGIRSATNAIPLEQAGTRMGLPEWAFEEAHQEHIQQWNRISQLDIERIHGDLNAQISKTYISEVTHTDFVPNRFVAELIRHYHFYDATQKIGTKKLIRELMVRAGLKRSGTLIKSLARVVNITKK